jgi:preprotein translocase subunit SecD
MKLTWWTKAALLGLVTALAALVVAPSVVPSDRLPAFLAKHARRMKPAVELVGGTRLVYELDADLAAASVLALEAPDLEERLRRDLGVADLSAHARTDGALVVKFANPAASRALTPAVARELGLVEHERNAELGGVVLRLDPAGVREMIDRKLTAALEVLDSRDQSACPRRARITRERDRIVIELPAIDPREAARVKQMIAGLF